MRIFTNARVILPGKILPSGYLLEKDGLIMSVGAMQDIPACSGQVIDCRHHYLSPGFVDLHTHGGGGFDYMDGEVEDVIGSARAHLSHGTTSLMPTTLTSSDKALYKTIDAYLEALPCRENMPNLLGLHLEGPYFSPAEKGAQDPQFLRTPSPGHYLPLLDYAQGQIRRLSFAPELPGALAMTRCLAKKGVLLSAAHTCATLADLRLAVEHGVRYLTHFYSGMSTITRQNGNRILGVVEGGYLLDELSVEIIADGIHLPPDLLRLILKCKSHDSICLCTDSMRAAGLPDGPSVLGAKIGGQAVIVEDGVAKMPDRSCFAGSVATADRLVRVMVQQAGLDLVSAVKMMSLNPARLAGFGMQKGSLEAGKDADLLLFDEQIQIQQVYVMGKPVTLPLT